MLKKAIIFLTKTFKKTFKNQNYFQRNAIEILEEISNNQIEKNENKNEKDCISQIKKNQKKIQCEKHMKKSMKLMKKCRKIDAQIK